MSVSCMTGVGHKRDIPCHSRKDVDAAASDIEEKNMAPEGAMKDSKRVILPFPFTRNYKTRGTQPY
jgi:hypothetical protein